MDSEQVVIHLPLRLGERAGHATVVDAKNHIVCEVPEIGKEWDGVAQAIVNAMNTMYPAMRTSMGNGHA
jgi:hypothetical protein